MAFFIKTALKFMFSTKNSQKSFTIFLITGIAVFLCVFICIVSVLNCLQSTQLDIIREVETYDLSVESSLSASDLQKFLPGCSVFNYHETTVLIDSKIFRLRALDLDKAQGLYFLSDDKNSGILLPYSQKENFYNLTSIDAVFAGRSKRKNNIKADSKVLDICGFYSSSLSSFNENTILCSNEYYSSVIGDKSSKIALYLNGYDEKEVYETILLNDGFAKITNWKEKTGFFYSALVLEKVLTLSILAILAVIICLNLRTSAKKIVTNTFKDSAVLVSMGYVKGKLVLLYLFQGLVIALAGVVLGNLLAFYLIEGPVLNSFLNGIFILNYNFFNSMIISLSIVVLCLVFTAFGITKLTRLNVSEVLSSDSNRM